MIIHARTKTTVAVDFHFTAKRFKLSRITHDFLYVHTPTDARQPIFFAVKEDAVCLSAPDFSNIPEEEKQMVRFLESNQ
jgi:hypothetical protein